LRLSTTPNQTISGRIRMSNLNLFKKQQRISKEPQAQINLASHFHTCRIPSARLPVD
jgi:hypothetical protein